MSWVEYLDRLRQEPEEKRRRVLWMATGTITAVIVFCWLLSWGYWSPIPAASQSGERQDWSTWLSEVKLKIITGWQTLKTK